MKLPFLACVITWSFAAVAQPTKPEYAPLFSREWLDGKEFSGDWGGLRNRLHEEGVSLFGSYTSNLAGNPVGGLDHGFTYCDSLRFGLKLDLDKLIGWKGGTFTVGFQNREGRSLSQKDIGNVFPVQQIYGKPGFFLFSLFLEQKFFDEKISLKLGRFGGSTDFASSPIYWLYMSSGINGYPQALSSNARFTSSSMPVWAARLRVNPTPEHYAMLGIYHVSDHMRPTYHGFDWSIRSRDSFLLVGQIGWKPEFFKKPIERTASEGDQLATSQGAGQKNVLKPVEKGFPAHFFLGAYWSPWNFPQFGRTETVRNAYGFYAHADQMIFQETPGSDQGLTLWSVVTVSPQENIAQIPFQINGGLVYKGLIPGRDDDYACFGVVYGKLGRDYARAVAPLGQRYHSPYELVFEWNYKIQLTKFAYVQPDIQWVINPGGLDNIPNAFVLGAQIGVTF